MSGTNAETSTHYVNPAPFDPYSIEKLSPTQERLYLAPQWKLIWWKFCRHRLALISIFFLVLCYLGAMFCEWVAPYHAASYRNTDMIYAPPQPIHLFDQGKWVGPFVYGEDFKLNMSTLKREYTTNTNTVYPLNFFCHGDSYLFWGMVPSDFHLFCPAKDGYVYLLGTDKLGHDVFSQITYGARVSLTIGIIGVSISFLLGIVIGGFAGYYGGWFDMIVQRILEIFQSIPHIPLLMALSAIIPPKWPPLFVYFCITLILGLMDWTGLARAVRSKLLALREEDYVMASQVMGAKPWHIIRHHLLPGFMSHLIASATLTLPRMILAETALSFLGLGLRPPIISWGVMLGAAQNLNIVALYPWLLTPIIPVMLVILAFNFVGDGLRDAADPYHQ